MPPSFFQNIYLCRCLLLANFSAMSPSILAVSFLFLQMLSFNAWKSVADSSFVQPAVSYQWRPAQTISQYKNIKFPREHPLTVEMMQKGMPKLSPQELHRFLPLIEKLSAQQRAQQAALASGVAASLKNVTVVSLGGSFALGTQCCVGNSWPHRFVEWLRQAYPLVPIQHIEFLKGSTNSLYGASLVRDLFDTVQVDLLLLGYALNDEVGWGRVSQLAVAVCHVCCLYCTHCQQCIFFRYSRSLLLLISHHS